MIAKTVLYLINGMQNDNWSYKYLNKEAPKWIVDLKFEGVKKPISAEGIKKTENYIEDENGSMKSGEKYLEEHKK